MRMNRFILLSAVVFLAVQANGGERVVATDSSAPRRFTLDEAILTALQRNPTLLIAEQEIKRTQGVIIQIRAEILPHINASGIDRKSTRLNSSHTVISYAVFCLKKKKKQN